MTKLTPQQKVIVDYLADGKWHCMTSKDFFMKDDRKRISELNQKGYTIESSKCDRRCGIQHSSPVLMRRLLAVPPPSPYEIYHALKANE